MKLTFKVLKYIFVSYFLTIVLAASLGKEGSNKYFGNNLLDEYLIIASILILIDIGIYVFKKRTRI